MKEPKAISVIGAGSWGTSLACILSHKGYLVRLWVYEPWLVDEIKSTRINSVYLPGIKLPDSILPTNSIAEAITDSHFIVSVTPSHTIRSILQEARPFIAPQSIIIGASKGIENKSLMRISEIVDDVLDGNPEVHYITLSGPTFASEVARFHPTTAVVAGQNPEALKLAQVTLSSKTFRVYIQTDQIGVELGGALKNVIAIATGICRGLKFGSNTRAAIITRGLWEIVRLGSAMGAEPLTFLGLAGMGDLILTCDGTQSRNFLLGVRIGEGERLDEIQSGMHMIAEGVKTTSAARDLAKKFNVEMPITEQVYQILYHGKNARHALQELMSRKLKAEHQMDEQFFS